MTHSNSTSWEVSVFFFAWQLGSAGRQLALQDVVEARCWEFAASLRQSPFSFTPAANTFSLVPTPQRRVAAHSPGRSAEKCGEESCAPCARRPHGAPTSEWGRQLRQGLNTQGKNPSVWPHGLGNNSSNNNNNNNNDDDNIDNIRIVITTITIVIIVIMIIIITITITITIIIIITTIYKIQYYIYV